MNENLFNRFSSKLFLGLRRWHAVCILGYPAPNNKLARRLPAALARLLPAALARRLPAALARRLPAALARLLPAALARRLPAALARRLPAALARRLPAALARRLPAAKPPAALRQLGATGLRSNLVTYLWPPCAPPAAL